VYNEVRRQRTAPYELVQFTTARAQGYRTPLPALNPAMTSTSDGMQPANNTMGGHKEIFRPMQLFEVGMLATDSTHHHSTYSRTSFLELLQGVRITTTIQSPRTVTASPQSTISWSQG